MRTLAILTLLTMTAAAPAMPKVVTIPVPSTIKPVCEDSSIRLAGEPSPMPGLHPLGDEPPARQILGVVRTIDGCSKPVVVRQMVGPKRR